jgi:hypothetical protein
MRYPVGSATVALQTFQRTLVKDDEIVLELSISYPWVHLPRNRAAQGRINSCIRAQVEGFYRYASTELYMQAVCAKESAEQNGYPFHAFEAVLNYSIAFNQDCHLSLYRDQYTYTGGAHGATVRASDTWSLITGALLPLGSFFRRYRFHKELLIELILKQAEEDMRENPGIYFNNYPALIRQHFDEQQYYLTPEGLAVYYQQYDIAPYASGIVVFVIPYASLGFVPSCLPRKRLGAGR